MVRKSFKAAVRDSALEFETSEGDVFQARPKMSAGIILRFTEVISADDDGNVQLSQIVKGMKEFFRGALEAEDYERFNRMLDDPDKGISLDELMDIAGWLAGVYTARPTGTVSPDGSPTSPTGTGSTDGALPVGTTFSRKEPDSVPAGSSA